MNNSDLLKVKSTEAIGFSCDNCLAKLSKLKRVYLYFFVFLTIYIEFGYRMVVTNQVTGNIRIVVLVLITIPLVFLNRALKINTTSFGLFAYLSILIMLNMIRDNTFENYILLFVPIFIGFVVVLTTNIRYFIHVFSNIMCFLAFYSLICFLIYIIAPGIIESLPSLGYRLTSTTEVHDAIFSVCLTGSAFIRNYGLTWEPGAFAVLLCIATYCNIAFYNSISLIKLIVLTAAVVTTFSTLGYFVLAGVYIIAAQKRLRSSRRLKKYVVGIILILVVSLLVLPDSVRDIVFSKLSGLFSDNGHSIAYTTQARINAVIYPARAFFSSPIVGVGYNKFSVINAVQCNGVATNTMLNWFAIMGVLLGLPCAFFYLKFIINNARYLKLKPFATLVFIIVSVLIMSTESLLRISIVYVLMFYGCKNNVFKENTNINEHSIYPRRI